MNEARSPSSTITITHIRFLNRNGVYNNNNNNPSTSFTPTKYALAEAAWCQTNEIDYCPLVISIMSFVIITSFLAIIYLCAKTSFQCPAIRCCSLFAKLRSISRGRRCDGSHAAGRHRRRRHRAQHQPTTSDSIFSLNTSTNYMNDSVSLHSINQMDQMASSAGPASTNNNRTAIQTPSAPMSARARAIWWITGGSFGKQPSDLVSHADLVIAPPTYDESQQLHRMMKSKRLQIVRKQPKQMATENAAFCMESSLSHAQQEQSPNSIITTSSSSSPSSTTTSTNQEAGTAQFPSYRCLSLTSSLRPSANPPSHSMSARGPHMVIDESACFQSTPSMRGGGGPLGAVASSLDLDSMSMMAYDEVPPPYEAVIVSESSTGGRCNQQQPRTQPVASFNSSLSARLANYSFRSSREFQI